MLIPQISGEWRTLLKPRRYGKYVNDHTLFYDDAGKRWCLAGITSKKGNPNDERYFVFADTPSLDCKMRDRAKIIDNGTRAWAPCVIKENGLYYLFTTYTDCSRSNYCNTLVFCSENPLDFGCYKGSGGNGALPAARLKCHAPEVVRDENGWHITTCGWKRSSFARGCVLTAPLEWREARSSAL